MKIISAKDIEAMVEARVAENLKATVGKGKNQQVVIAPGFKLEHIKSGLTYTVKDVRIEKGKPILTATAGDGNPIEIHSSDFKQYRGL
jgi:hypothetical protein